MKKIRFFKIFNLSLFFLIIFQSYSQQPSINNFFNNQGPISLRNNIRIKYLGNTINNAVRIVYDEKNNNFYVNNLLGDIYKIKISENLISVYEFINHKKHNLSRVQGMLFYNNFLYLSGNKFDETGFLSKGEIIKFKIDSNQVSDNFQKVLTTENYVSSNVLYDHNFTSLALNKTKESLLIASGSRTDHGEVKDLDGKFEKLREQPLTGKIFIIPLNLENEIYLENNYEKLKNSGVIFSEGVRNEFSISMNTDGEIFGVENNGDRDDPEELNWLRNGFHYGFPWIMGDNYNPQQFNDYDPELDKLLPDNLFKKSIFYNDLEFPKLPQGIEFTKPIINLGPDANWIRNPESGQFTRKDTVYTFTSHRSPLGLNFDTKNLLGDEYTSKGFVLAYSKGGGTDGYLNVVDSGSDLCMIDLEKDSQLGYKSHIYQIAKNFNSPVDAILVENNLYVLQNDGNVFMVTFPLNLKKPELKIFASNDTIKIGESVTFHAQILNFWKRPDYVWYLNDKKIDSKDSSLTINNLNNGDKIKCKLLNYFEKGFLIELISNEIEIKINYEDLDDDNDGILNKNDKCPNSPSSAKVGEDGCDIILGKNIEYSLINIYPNPFNKNIHILFNDAFGDFVKLQFFNLKGLLIFEKEYVENDAVIDLQEFFDQIIILKIQSNKNKSKIIKLVKN